MIAALLWLLAGLLIVFALYSMFIEPRQLRLTRHTVYLPHLPPELDGLCVAHLADLHLKSEQHRHPQEMTARAVQMALDLQPDLVCVTGDLGQCSRHIGVACRLLAPLAGPPGFVVMGNHDHDKLLEHELHGPPEVRVGASEWSERVAAAGMTVLRNGWTDVTVRGRRVRLVGCGDPSCGWDDLERALPPAGVPEADLHLLLVHSPDLVDDPRTDWADLVLCGHTHGGQLRLPGIGTPWAPVWRDRRRAAGLFAVGQTQCHVTRGVSAGIRARFLCWPEVAALTLRRGEPDRLPRLRRFPTP